MQRTPAFSLCGLLLALVALTVPAPSASAGKKTPRPNIVFLLCDDLGYGDLGSFGSRVIRTPHLDRMAKEGLKLTDCYSASPVCSPSRAGLMTGRDPNRLGIRDWIPQDSGIYLKREEVTVAELLKSAGYRTGFSGKWHLSSRMDGTEPTPGDHGWDHWFATQNNAAPSHQDPANFVRNGKPVGPLKGNASTLVVDEALRFIDAERDAPFALFVWFHAPHEPVATPEEFTRRYPSVDDPSKAVYYGSVSLVDHEIGRLMAALEERKLRENTFVMFTSDNGPETLRRYRGAERSHGSPGPYRGMKLHVHEAGYRVPGIISWPGKVRSGQMSEEPVSGVDLLPTLCELAGVKPPEDRPLDGATFTPVLQGKPIRRARPLYWQYDRAISRPWTVSLREGPWKLLATAALDRFALYHLADDPAETKDLAAEQPERARRMAETLRRRHREINGGVQ